MSPADEVVSVLLPAVSAFWLLITSAVFELPMLPVSAVRFMFLPVMFAVELLPVLFKIEPEDANVAFPFTSLIVPRSISPEFVVRPTLPFEELTVLTFIRPADSVMYVSPADDVVSVLLPVVAAFWLSITSAVFELPMLPLVAVRFMFLPVMFTVAALPLVLRMEPEDERVAFPFSSLTVPRSMSPDFVVSPTLPLDDATVFTFIRPVDSAMYVSPADDVVR